MSTGNLAPNDGYQYVGHECWITGWGSAELGGAGPGPTVLQEAQMDILGERGTNKNTSLTSVKLRI